MSKRLKKKFNSDTSVIDFQAYLPGKKPCVYLTPRNSHQMEFIEKLQSENTSVVLAIGPAGTGKTLLAVQMGIKLLQANEVDRIVITRPAVSVDEDIGFLPGTINQKMEPWTRPIFDIFAEYYFAKDIENMLAEGTLEISPLAYMRGRTFKKSYIIADEMQNATSSQTKMLLTRLGQGSKMVVTGDLGQADRLKNNGLIEFCELIKNQPVLKHIDIQYFDKSDIERHVAVKEILEIYGD